MHNKLVQNFEFKINTKETQKFQSSKQMTWVYTQAEPDPTSTCKVSIQCNIKRPKTDGDENLETASGEDTSQEIRYSLSNQSESEYSSSNESTSASLPSKTATIVYRSSLTVLLNKYLT